jgi:hypothetical protein
MMGEPPKPEIEVIRPEVEILPPDHSEPGAGVAGSRVWLSVDSHAGTRRVHVAKPGPLATILLVLGFGLLLTVSFVVALGLFAILVGISVVALAGLMIYAVVRGALNRLR